MSLMVTRLANRDNAPDVCSKTFYLKRFNSIGARYAFVKYLFVIPAVKDGNAYRQTDMCVICIAKWWVWVVVFGGVLFPRAFCWPGVDSDKACFAVAITSLDRFG